MRTIAFLLILCLSLPAAAQRNCATEAYASGQRIAKTGITHIDSKLPSKRQQSVSRSAGQGGTQSNELQSSVIHIPVVVHVLYNTPGQNISDAQIKSAIAALNRDFRRQNADTVNTPERFKAVAADVEIEFHLAITDPRGRATSGIVRKQTTLPAFNMDDKIKMNSQGGSDAWDTKSYLNIWVGNTRRLLGYATAPGSNPALDGVVINLTAFGTINTAAPYHLGRTAVHEIGHWLGLHHLWGDTACGDDEVADTPAQGGYTSGCPTVVRSSCGNSTVGDMYMNYMDFTNDACMNLFTLGQKERMHSFFNAGEARASLLASKGLSAPWVEEAPLLALDSLMQKENVFPNPAKNEVTLQCAGADSYSGTVYLISASGLQLQKIPVTSGKQRINLTGLPNGLYFIQGIVNNSRIQHRVVKLN